MHFWNNRLLSNSQIGNVLIGFIVWYFNDLGNVGKRERKKNIISQFKRIFIFLESCNPTSTLIVAWWHVGRMIKRKRKNISGFQHKDIGSLYDLKLQNIIGYKKWKYN